MFDNGVFMHSVITQHVGNGGVTRVMEGPTIMRRTYETAEELQARVDEYFAVVGTHKNYRVPNRIGLNYFLGVTKNDFYNMARNPVFEDVLAMAMLRCEQWEAEELLTRPSGSLEGLKFSLGHNYDWRARSEIEFGGETRAALSRSLPMAEKAAFILDKQGAMLAAQAKLEEMRAMAIDVEVSESEKSEQGVEE